MRVVTLNEGISKGISRIADGKNSRAISKGGMKSRHAPVTEINENECQTMCCGLLFRLSN